MAGFETTRHPYTHLRVFRLITSEWDDVTTNHPPINGVAAHSDSRGGCSDGRHAASVLDYKSPTVTCPHHPRPSRRLPLLPSHLLNSHQQCRRARTQPICLTWWRSGNSRRRHRATAGQTLTAAAGAYSSRSGGHDGRPGSGASGASMSTRSFPSTTPHSLSMSRS